MNDRKARKWFNIEAIINDPYDKAIVKVTTNDPMFQARPAKWTFGKSLSMPCKFVASKLKS